ncbi:MAG TPA: hypothetical protein VJX92_22155 [Methylomirabilota bacterium]|nr:hypothetical protein [Methylomirabilota bacterium]
MITKADQRLVVNAPARFENGRNTPRQIFCAEPSPDVAKALAESTNVSGALDAVVRAKEAPAEGALKAAAAISRSRAEALAQLTNRLATIQLLRDGLYRACEAYANGALSEITYAIILSRFDKLMVTLLTGELVAGNFGQSLAVLGTSASGVSQSGAAKAQQDANKAAESQKTLDAARDNLDTKKNDASTARKALETCQATPGADCSTQRATLDEKNRDVATANDKVTNALVDAMGDVSAAAGSGASAIIAQAVGGLPGGRAPAGQGDVTEALASMQKRFLENINADPLIVACLTAFDRERGAAEIGDRKGSLVSFCHDQFPRVLQAQEDLLRARLIDSQGQLILGCTGAFRDSSSQDVNVAAAAKTLAAFCEAQLLQILKTQAELSMSQQRLQDARRELQPKPK